ncbi:hypothetical protein G3I40_15790 [Streptomyces sp. SID14478]|uniref:Zn-ribbon domain-containing OB-fold protein n=1 Tax=Streptomyces sp. SID14478 TaxID=2706073 RepID=UPI0013DB6457|nr:OB-fold domain-containing protein [Streptomyces sp. SID14478]NEB76672.1 hypothetical protein [Streptomyces sp. SID14478]
MSPTAVPRARSGTGGVPSRGAPLLFQRCRWCRTPSFRRVLCPACGSGELDEERSAGLGVVRSVKVVRRHATAPLAVAVVELAEGVRIRATVVGGGYRADAVFVGDRVEATGPAGAPTHRPTFRLSETLFAR